MLNQVERLGAEHVMPSHSPAGDGALVAKEKAFIVDLQTNALALKQKRVSVKEAGRRLTDEFKKKYPGWDVSKFVKSIYAYPATEGRAPD